jgi:hypothetical protein
VGKALIAVGTFLGVCFLIFGGVVYFTRDEDTYAVDAALSERITKAVAEAPQRREDVDLRALTGFDFDRVLIFPPGTSRDEVSGELGFEFRGELRYTAESSEIFVFTNNGAFVRFADYRGPSRFAGLATPFTWLTANDAVFSVRDGVIRPT